MRSYWDLSYIIDLQEEKIMLMRMKMSHNIHIVSLFRYGLIRIVVMPSGRMIKLMVSLSSKISSLPPISMIFILRFIIHLFMLMIIMHWTYLCCFT
jgi:hypothetical protein